jgi:hypothetical protein
MMKQMILAFMLCVLATVSHAATLTWDAQTIVSPLTVERSTTQTGPYEVIATLPTGAVSYILTPGAYGWYRVRNSAGPSNVVQFSLDLYTGLVTDRLTALETRVTALETVPVVVPPPPAPTSNLTVRQIDADHIEITCNGIGISTTGSGTRRFMECRH